MHRLYLFCPVKKFTILSFILLFHYTQNRYTHLTIIVLTHCFCSINKLKFKFNKNIYSLSIFYLLPLIQLKLLNEYNSYAKVLL